MAKVLVVDDDGVVREALQVFLTRYGHEVRAVGDGNSALLALRREMPDLVVLDRDLPVMTGSAVLQRIRKVSASVPVVILTGYYSPEDAERYLLSGATAFLSKADGLLKALDEIDRILGTGAPKAPPPLPPLPPRPAARAPAAAAPAAAPVRPSGRSRGRVLVADDDAAMTDVISRSLSTYGFEVLVANNGERAEALARSARPVVVILDIVMPGKDGVQVLRDLVPEMPDTGFIMLSGNEDEEIARACLKIGAFDYLSKPANLGALETLVRACMLEKSKT